MAEFIIKDEDLTGIKGKVVIVTGSSSGIGLATVNLLLSLGASVVGGDINPPSATSSTESPEFLFVQTNVTSWADLSNLFKQAKERHQRIDYVFANAGIGPRADYLSLATDENGELKEPSHEVLDINLKSVVNTASLAVHYLKQQSEGGSIVLMGSSTGLQPLRAPDYSTAKHGVLGFGRGYARLVEAAGLPIRINTLMPCWTTTSILPNMDGLMKGISHEAQTGLVVARCTAHLMVDASKHGNVIYIADGKYKEIEKAVLWPAYESIKGEGNPSDDDVLKRIFELAQ
ncbi:putative 15-hydroxyprostaglandin dehydrogenase [Talaromyces proteolyticus]|uniref:15-hydroxyprostaglandin dehydrogenase n=1 Tax=Talaromyces proteolyticus TaxID=1131652 RepID=A0AAD4KX35_9EURO|nr:putative 15-hydroxyprostaglandin dehydrogenase [Talaromyces proteolyticus]KAH8701911.1 putative 15-hydroxyprostaglandin dehydrogenase [Talaromyces proteolyticus]